MKKENFFKRHRILLSIITLIVIVILYTRKPWIDNSPKSKVYYDMETTVQTGTLENSLTLQGTTQFADSQKLTFMTQGKVIAVNVKVGDKVKKGQVLAKISTDDLDNSAEQTRLDIENQKNALQDLLSNRNIDLEYLQEKANHDALILQQETIDQDQELAMQTLLQQIKDAQKLYDETLADYQELLSGNNSANADLALSSTIRKRNQTLENGVLELKTIINTVNAALDTYDKKLIITNKYRYEVARNDYIGADDLFSKNKSETLFHQINKNLETLKGLYEALNGKEVSKLTSEEVINAYSTVKTIGNELVERGETSYNMFKSSITSSSYSLSDIDNDANIALNNQNLGLQYIQKYTSMVSTLADLDDDTSLEDTKLKLDKAKTSLDKLNLQIDVLKATQEKEKAALKDQINTSLQNLNKISGGESLNESQITTAKNRLKQLERSLKNVLDKYEDYQLTANFDGVITQMDLQIGDSINPSNTNNQKYIYVESNDILEMSFSVEQIDIIKLKVGMDAEVYLDAYPNEIYKGKISEINTIPNTSSMTTTYPMTIIFSKNDPNETILAGMGGSAKIILHKTEDVLVVPSQAITTISGQQMVMLKKGDQWIETPVEIGDSDNTNTEIISGLENGDIIKSMFYSTEGMINAGLSMEKEVIDIESMREESMRNNASRYNGFGGEGGGGGGMGGGRM